MAEKEDYSDFNFYPKYNDPNFRPYAIAIGELALAWNGLHDVLGRLFWTIVGKSNYASLAVWHSIKA
ncbi:MAG: hypothetical protein NTZ72_14715, partial [Afipia sp.]|nr:hypothetical protein [Afipia sp.]